MVTLRDYQEQAVAAILRDWEQHTDVLMTMATGGGKTLVFLTVLDRVLTAGRRGLVLAHRKELIDQPLARLMSYYPHWWGRAGVVMADQDDTAKQITIATVQTLASPRRLERLLEAGPIDFLVTDESHHATAASYRQVYDRLRQANPDMRHLGVTATPIRADGDGLGGVFQTESAHYGIVELIRKGHLAPVRWLAIQTNISLKGVTSRAGDFAPKSLAAVYETDDCWSLVVESHQRYAAERQAVAFTTTVEGAYALAERFQAAGVSAAAADGTTERRKRQAILDDFSSGRTQVLCNVGLYTEGLDVPQASCIHQVRPTKSDGLYMQMVGRALRTYPGKADALVLDYAPIEKRNIAMLGDILGVPLRRDSYVKEEAKRGEAAGGFTFDGAFKYSADGAEIIARQLDYLQISPWSWHRGSDGWMSLGLGEANDKIERTLVLSPAQDGTLRLYGCWRDKESRRWRARLITSGQFEELRERADELADKWGNAGLAMRARGWRTQPPSDKQLAYATRIGAARRGMSRGELAQAITHRLALRAIGGE